MDETRKVIPEERLKERLFGIDQNLKDLRSDLDRIQKEISTLESHRALIATLLKDAVPASGKNGQDKPKSTTDVLINHIRLNPGQTTRKIVDCLENDIQSKSSDKRQMLYTMVSNLRRRGMVRKDGDGGHFVIEKD